MNKKSKVNENNKNINNLVASQASFKRKTEVTSSKDTPIISNHNRRESKEAVNKSQNKKLLNVFYNGNNKDKEVKDTNMSQDASIMKPKRQSRRGSITSGRDEVKVKKDDSSESQHMFKDMIEKQDINYKVDLFINDTIELLTKNTLAFGREDAERYELIEKEEFVKLKKSNIQLKDEEDLLIDEYNKIVEEQNSVFKDLTNLNKRFNVQEKVKNDNMMKINDLKLKNRDLLVKNEKLTLAIKENVAKKDNIYKTIVHMNSTLKRPLPKSIKEICNKVDLDKLNTSTKNVSVEKLEYLQSTVNNLEEKLALYSNKPNSNNKINKVARRGSKKMSRKESKSRVTIESK